MANVVSVDGSANSGSLVINFAVGGSVVHAVSNGQITFGEITTPVIVSLPEAYTALKDFERWYGLCLESLSGWENHPSKKYVFEEKDTGDEVEFEIKKPGGATVTKGVFARATGKYTVLPRAEVNITRWQYEAFIRFAQELLRVMRVG